RLASAMMTRQQNKVRHPRESGDPGSRARCRFPWIPAFAGMTVGIVLSVCALLAPALAQDYPNRAVRIINPWPAGGSSDSVTRIVAQKLSEELGQQMIVDNRPGATGTIGSAAAAIAPADGYTLLLTTNSTTAIAPHLYKNLTYEVTTAFAPINLVG